MNKRDNIIYIVTVLLSFVVAYYFFRYANGWKEIYESNQSSDIYELYKKYLWYASLSLSILWIIIPSLFYLLFSVIRKVKAKYICLVLFIIDLGMSILLYLISLHNNPISIYPTGMIVFSFIITISQRVYYRKRIIVVD